MNLKEKPMEANEPKPNENNEVADSAERTVDAIKIGEFYVQAPQNEFERDAVEHLEFMLNGCPQAVAIARAATSKGECFPIGTLLILLATSLTTMVMSLTVRVMLERARWGVLRVMSGSDLFDQQVVPRIQELMQHSKPLSRLQSLSSTYREAVVAQAVDSGEPLDGPEAGVVAYHEAKIVMPLVRTEGGKIEAVSYCPQRGVSAGEYTPEELPHVASWILPSILEDLERRVQEARGGLS
jgi:hypothetical protein